MVLKMLVLIIVKYTASYKNYSNMVIILALYFYFAVQKNTSC